MVAKGAFALGACVVLLLAATPTAQAGEEITVNIVQAFDRGCSNDQWPVFGGDADLRVTVIINGATVLQTVKAQGENEPWYADSVRLPAPSSGATVQVRVEEAEPGGFFGAGTDWIECDVSPGDATLYTTQWNGGVLSIVARGDRERAAEAHVVVGPGAPRTAVVSSQPGTEDASVSWDADATGQTTAHELGWNNFRRGFHTADAGSGSHTITGLCDGLDYWVRVLREASPWLLATSHQFSTINIAPEPAFISEVTSPGAERAVNVTFQTESSHDVQQYEIHAGPSGFLMDDGSLRGTLAFDRGNPSVTAVDITLEMEDEMVVVRTVDRGGLRSDSEPFAVGAARAARDILPGCGNAEPLSMQQPPSAPPPATSTFTPPPTPDVLTPTIDPGRPIDIDGPEQAEPRRATGFSDDVPAWAYAVGSFLLLGITIAGVTLAVMVGRRR